MWKFRRGCKLVNFTYSLFLRNTQLQNLRMIAENVSSPSYYSHHTHLLYCTSLICSDNASIVTRIGVADEIGCANDEIGCVNVGIGRANGENECANDENGCANNENGCAKDENGCANNENGCAKDENGCINVDIGRASDEIECANDENGCANDGDDGEGGHLSGEDDEIEIGSLGIKDEKFNHEVETLLEILRGHGNEIEEKDPIDKAGVVSGVEVAKKLKQCGINPTSELVIEVLAKTRNDWEVAFMFFLWAGKQPEYEHSLRVYHSMISILAKRRKFDTAWTLIDEMRKKEIVNPNTLLIMIRRYSAAHDVTNAINTFHAFKRFDLRVGMEEFHKLISALTRYKNVQEAEHLLFSNRNIFQFNTKSFNIILNGWCNIIGSPREGNRFWRLMINERIKLDVISYSSIISSYSKFNKVKEVIKLFEEMMQMGLKPDRKVYNAVMYALAKGGRGKEALSHLHIMAEKGIAPDSVTFNSLIKPLCRARSRDEAQKVYDEMLRRGLRPTIRTFHAFLRIQRTEEDIFMLLDKMKEMGCNPNKDTYLLLIKKFLRWQKLDTAFKFWHEMKENGWNDDSSSYITLIHGLFLNGKLEEAHKIYLEMKAKSLLPDAKTDELIQSWLSNKEMAESQTINAVPSFVDGDNVSGMGKSFPNKRNKGKDPQKEHEFRKVVQERGFSFWE